MYFFNVVTLETGAWLYGVHITCAETAAVSRGTSHITSKLRCQYTTSLDIEKRAIKKKGKKDAVTHST